MSKNRMFRGKPTGKLIIRIERETIEAIDKATVHRPGGIPGNRSEFIRRAIEARLRAH
ncbi:MAG: toxin-antitoxin system protein [Porticoccaceae bacterium]|nr:toxin-antitoxin system protein [Porticoccaceae bacterium]